MNSKFYFEPSDWREGRWINIELEYKDSDMDTVNGIYTVWHSLSDQQIIKRPYAEMITRTNENKMDCISLGYTIVNYGAGGEAITYWDDIYIDNSWARVVIGDNSNYDSCAHCEIQIPTAWLSDGTSITITVNQGSFTPCETYYLFVVDADGVPSAGYPVKIVTGSGGKPCRVLDGERIAGP